VAGAPDTPAVANNHWQLLQTSKSNDQNITYSKYNYCCIND
jgi:hypothetical protein